MGHIIAVAGKGGVGKTTLTGLLIQYLCESGKKPVLAVDADANANLNEVLGFIHYHLSIIEADRLGKSPYDCSLELVKDIVQRMGGENL